LPRLGLSFEVKTLVTPAGRIEPKEVQFKHCCLGEGVNDKFLSLPVSADNMLRAR
jgi:hypothetical protein